MDTKSTLRKPPRYSSESLGSVAAMQKGLHAQVRTLKCDVKTRFGIELESDSVAWTWLAGMAAWHLEPFAVRANGRTSYDEQFQIRYRGEVLPFLETAAFRHSFSPTGRLPKSRKVRRPSED